MGRSWTFITIAIDYFNSDSKIFSDGFAEAASFSRRKEKRFEFELQFRSINNCVEFTSITSFSTISDIINCFFISELEIVSGVAIVKVIKRFRSYLAEIVELSTLEIFRRF